MQADLLLADGPITCRDACCWKTVPAVIAHPGMVPGLRPETTTTRLTHEDFLSPVNNKRMADVAFGGLPKPKGYAFAPELSLELLPCLQNGTAIWVDTPSLDEFARDWLPKINVQFILLSGDSDAKAPGQYLYLLQVRLVGSVQGGGEAGCRCLLAGVCGGRWRGAGWLCRGVLSARCWVAVQGCDIGEVLGGCAGACCWRGAGWLCRGAILARC